MQGTVVQGTVVEGAVVQGTVLQGSAVQGTALQGSAVQGTVLQGSAVQGTVLQGSVVFTGTIIQGTAAAQSEPFTFTILQLQPLKTMSPSLACCCWTRLGALSFFPCSLLSPSFLFSSSLSVLPPSLPQHPFYRNPTDVFIQFFISRPS